MWTVIALFTPAAEAAACDRSELAELVELLDEASELDRSFIAAGALAEVCTGPKGWVDGLADRVGAPHMQQAIDLKVAAEAPLEWMAVCSGGLEALTELSTRVPSEHRPLLWQRCELGRHGWMTERQWLAAQGPIVLPLVGGHVLTEAAVPADQVGALVRALAGVRRSVRAPGDSVMGVLEGSIGEVSTNLGEIVLPNTGSDVLGMAAELEARGGDGGSAQQAMLGTKGSQPPADRRAGFAPGGRVDPDWNKKTLKHGDVCTVEVHVTLQGELDDWKVVQCDMFLEPRVAAALDASTFQSGREDGAPAAGRFQVTYEVP